jgi:hypothetical protein
MPAAACRICPAALRCAADVRLQVPELRVRVYHKGIGLSTFGRTGVAGPAVGGLGLRVGAGATVGSKKRCPCVRGIAINVVVNNTGYPASGTTLAYACGE